MFQKIVVSNRGAVAARVLHALRGLGIRSVAVCSEVDRDLPYLALADEVHEIGPGDARESYLNQERLIQVVKSTGADGVHPGYGFLSENASFARAVEATGARFIGPSPHWIDAMGHKTRARELMAGEGVNVGLASALLTDEGQAVDAARRIGYPVLVKAAAGGGGIGMAPAHDEAQLIAAFQRTRDLAARSFGNGDVYLERLLLSPRHIEFQILADRHGAAMHLFERDCSVQRRHQKIVEESPAPLLPRAWLDSHANHMAERLGRMGYDVIGTVETLNDGSPEFSFLEMNTRLQVEHAVTEEITGIDLVAAQIRLAWGEPLAQVVPGPVTMRGHALEVRVYAEDPVRFFPSPGVLTELAFPEASGVRIETGYAAGCRVSHYYDPMIAKVIVHADTRLAALQRMRDVLGDTRVTGVKTNIPFLERLLDDADFIAGRIDTGIVGRIQKSTKTH